MIDLCELSLPDAACDREFLDTWIHDFGACALSAADELGLFDALAQAPKTHAELARELALDRAATRAVCRALSALGALESRGGAFGLTSCARLFWVEQSPCYRGLEFRRHRDWEQHARIVETLKLGGSPLIDRDESFSEAWSKGRVSPQSAEDFTRVMHSMILAPSLAAVRSGAFSGVRHLVDVGGGSGALAAALVAHQPECRATVMDLEPVCEASRRILADTSRGAAVKYFAANFFEDAWPGDADAFCLSNVLHDWPPHVCRQLLDRAFGALPPGGRLFVHEALLDPGACSPRAIAIFNLLMFMNHQGQQFTLSELSTLLEDSRFCNVQVVARYSYWSLVAAEKAP